MSSTLRQQRRVKFADPDFASLSSDDTISCRASPSSTSRSTSTSPLPAPMISSPERSECADLDRVEFEFFNKHLRVCSADGTSEHYVEREELFTHFRVSDRIELSRRLPDGSVASKKGIVTHVLRNLKAIRVQHDGDDSVFLPPPYGGCAVTEEQGQVRAVRFLVRAC